MKEIEFVLRPEDEYIELIKLLKLQSVAQTGGHAKMMVEEGSVVVDGVVEYRKRNKLRAGAVVEVAEEGVRILVLGDNNQKHTTP